MEFNLRIIVAKGVVADKIFVIHDLSGLMNIFFRDKNYGNGLLAISIEFILVGTKQGYEDWYKVRNPTFTDSKIVRSNLTGIEQEINKALRYDIKL